MADPAVHRDQPRRLRGPARGEDPEGGRPHRQTVAPGVPVLGGDRGGQAPAQVLQRAPLAETGAAERPLVQIGDPQVPGPLDLGDGQRRTVPGQQQPGEDRVLRVVRARRVVAHEALDPAPAAADLGGPHVLRRGAQRIADREAQQRAPGPVAEAAPGRTGRVRSPAYRRPCAVRPRHCRISCGQLHRVDPPLVPSQYSSLWDLCHAEPRQRPVITTKGPLG